MKVAWIAAAGLLFAGCGVRWDNIGTTNESGSQTPANSPTTTAPPSHSPLATLIVPAPPGFASSTRVSVHNGNLTAAAFAKWLSNDDGSDLTALYFTAGYSMTYDASNSSDDVEVTVLEFAKSQNAEDFTQGFSFGDQPGTSTDDPEIPDGYDFNGQKADSDGSYEHGVIATKGNRVLVIDYASGSSAPVALVATMAKAQYAAL